MVLHESSSAVDSGIFPSESGGRDDLQIVRFNEPLERRAGERIGLARAASPAPSVHELASQLGNQAFARMLARDDTPAADPAADAKTLLAETPKNDVEYATWLLKAVDQGFATLWKDTRTELEDLRDGKKTDKGATPSTTDVKLSGLVTMYDVVKGPMRRWAADPKAKKAPVALGSFIRDAAGPHGGAAIDLPRVMGAGTAAEVVQMLGDLSVAGYGIGLPFSGDYFDPADELATKQAAARDAAGDGEPKPVTGAVTLDAAHTYGCEWDAAAKAWKKPTIEQAGQAYEKLKSTALKDQLAAMRKAGAKLTIFPDRKGHVHIDRR